MFFLFSPYFSPYIFLIISKYKLVTSDNKKEKKRERKREREKKEKRKKDKKK
jgi:hypothetical protein